MPSAQIHSILPRELGSLPSTARRIDVREPAEFDGMLGRLPRSELVPLATLPGAAMAWPRDVPLLLICRSGARSMKAARMLAGQGFTALYNLEGGMLAVHEAELPVEGPGVGPRVSAGQARDALCAAARELYGALTPPPCESLFEGPSAFPQPERATLLQALERLGARARADGLASEAIDYTLRRMRDLTALVEDRKGASS
ncbi:rhodanese-like domain-containing protein [Hyalangium gracile]|uniref:rhodanese-like domain-containing protein n=1 Tax=Hyalangium gracile TaxID=394092 RepID=UPI001CCE2B90|nr:rhodanese-like domain-containing protein [Hyalangium gracile]